MMNNRILAPKTRRCISLSEVRYISLLKRKLQNYVVDPKKVRNK